MPPPGPIVAPEDALSSLLQVNAQFLPPVIAQAVTPIGQGITASKAFTRKATEIYGPAGHALQQVLDQQGHFLQPMLCTQFTQVLNAMENLITQEESHTQGVGGSVMDSSSSLQQSDCLIAKVDGLG